MENKKKKPIVFGRICPHCHAPHQVYGMKCLECGKFIFTTVQIVVIFVILVVCAIAAIGYFSQFQGGKEITSIVFAVVFVLAFKNMFK